jgi:hypothetical protein
LARHCKVLVGTVKDGDTDNQAGENSLTTKIYNIISDPNVLTIDNIEIAKFGKVVVALVVYST